MKIRTAIVDNEIHCIETLRYDLQENFHDKVDVVYTCQNSVEATKNLKKIKPDLLFLDIEMPGLNGFDILELLDSVPMKIVFTTAYSEYAIKAVSFKAEAYLLKPVQPDDLKVVMDAIYNDLNKSESNPAIKDKLPVAYQDGIELIPYREIIYCHSNDNYTDIFLLSGRKIVASKTLKHFAELLPGDKFFRIHKSYLVNLMHIRKYLKLDGGVLLMQNEASLPVSRTKKEELLKLIRTSI